MKRVHESLPDSIGDGALELNKPTPAMIEAGADVIWRAFYDSISYGSGTGREVAIEVYQAMRFASLPRPVKGE